MRSMSASALRHLAADAPGVDHDDAVGEGEDLLELAGDQQHGDAVVGGGAQALAHELDGPDVEAAGRLGGDEDRRTADSSRASTTRCWLPPDSDANGASGPAQAMPYSSMRRRRPAAAGRPVDAGQGARPRPSSSRPRFSATERSRTQPASWRSSGISADAGRGHRAGAPGRARRRRRPRRPRVEREQAAEHVDELGLPVALDAGDADDLAGVDVERQVVEAGRRGEATTRIADAQRRWVGVGDVGSARPSMSRAPTAARSTSPSASRLGAQRDRPADHRLGERPGVGVDVAIESTTRPRRRIVTTSVAWRISSSLWLTSATALPSSRDGDAQHGEQLLGLLRGEHRRRLVEDDDVRIAPQALDDLDPLAESGGELADDRVGVEAEAVAIADLADEGAGRAGGRACPFAEHDVLPHAQLVDEAEVLVDHADAERRRALRVGDPLRRAPSISICR